MFWNTQVFNQHFVSIFIRDFFWVNLNTIVKWTSKKNFRFIRKVTRTCEMKFHVKNTKIYEELNKKFSKKRYFISADVNTNKF